MSGLKYSKKNQSINFSLDLGEKNARILSHEKKKAGPETFFYEFVRISDILTRKNNSAFFLYNFRPFVEK